MGLGGVTFRDKVRVTFKVILSIWVGVRVRVKVRVSLGLQLGLGLGLVLGLGLLFESALVLWLG